MVVVDFRIAAEFIDQNLALILLTDDAACRFEVADMAVAHFCRAVLILLDIADLDMFPSTAVLKDESPLAGRQFPLMERPSIHIRGEKPLEDGVLRRKSDMGSGGASLHLYIALDLHIVILFFIDVRRTGRIYIKRRLTARDDLAAADTKLAPIYDNAGGRFDVHHAGDMKTCRAIMIFHVDALVFRLNLDSVRRIARILDVEIGMLCQMNPVIFCLDGKGSQFLHLQRTASDEKSYRLCACPALVRPLILLARASREGKIMPFHIDLAFAPLTPHQGTVRRESVHRGTLDKILIPRRINRQCGIFMECILRSVCSAACTDAFLFPMILLIVCAVPRAFSNLASTVVLDAALSRRFIEENIFDFHRL